MGEYAVLTGQTAVVAAVDRRAVCVREASPHLVVSDAQGEPYVGVIEGSAARFAADEGDELKLLRNVFDAALARGHDITAAAYAVQTRAFSNDRGIKLGLGSSAAACVSLAAQLVVRRDDQPLDVHELHAVARNAHARFSSGRGSGIDVAASTYGGFLTFRDGTATTAPPIPEALDIVVTFAGNAQDTRTFVGRFLTRPAQQGLVKPIVEATMAFLDACDNESGPELLRAVDAGREAMKRLGEAADIDVVSAPHAAIARMAAAHGGAAKPSGAGGGDVGLCFVPRDASEALRTALDAAGFSVVSMTLGAEGARIDR